MTLTLNGMLLCAAGAAYNIIDTSYDPSGDPIYNQQLQWPELPGGNPLVFTSDQASGYDDACYVGKNDIGIIVAARGTLFNTPGYIQDWLVDFHCEPEGWYKPGSASDVMLPGLVHSGFFGAVSAVYPGVLGAVQQFLKEDPGTPVYITGHSKGGGMAPLIAYLLHCDGITAANVVTFAAPKPGNGAFQAAYNAVFPGDRHLRFENYGDLIPVLWPTGAVVNDLLNAISDLFSSWWPTFAADITSAGSWNYQPVGKGVFINNSDEKQSFITDPAVIAIDQVPDIAVNIAWYADSSPSVADTLFMAHTIGCCAPGFSTFVVGYLSALCPGLCTQPCPATATMPRHA